MAVCGDLPGDLCARDLTPRDLTQPGNLPGNLTQDSRQ